jgi:mannose-6-phosphate isomerase-like protein (cupin superfamily)
MELRGKIVTAADAFRANVFGTFVDIRLSATETGGAYSLYEVTVAPGDGPPPHVQSREDEAFTVLEGEFEVLCGEQITRIGPGASVFLPRHIPHTFKNVGQATGRLMGIATPAGHEAFFLEVDRLSRNGPLSQEEAIAVCRRHGMELMLPGESATENQPGS